MFFCFKQIPLNDKEKFESLYHLFNGERLLSVVVGIVSFLADKLLHFHDFFSIAQYFQSIIKRLKY